MLAHVERQYAALAERYVGQHDEPEPWIAGLKDILQEVESIEKSGAKLSVSVVW